LDNDQAEGGKTIKTLTGPVKEKRTRLSSKERVR